VTVRLVETSTIEPSEADEPADSSTLGVRLLAAGDPAAALPWLRAAVAGGKPGPVIRLNLALAEQHAGDPNAGLAIMQAVAEEYPAWDEPHLRLAEYWRALGDRERTIAAYEATLDRQPARPEALLSLAILFLSRGEPRRAQELLRRSVAVDPGSWQAWDATGAALRVTADYEAAFEACARAQRLVPSQLDVALRFAEAALKVGRGEAALATLRQCSVTDPLSVAPLAAMALLVADKGDTDQAIDLLDAAAALAPDDPLLAEMRADWLMRAGRHDAAAEAFRHALDLRPNNAATRNNYAAMLARTHRHREAREELERLLADHGENALLLCNLAGSESCLGEQALAVEHARRATELAPDSNFIFRSLANAQCYADGANGAAMLATLRRAGEVAIRGRLPPFRARPGAHPQQRLRVGLLSASLRRHPVGFLTLAGLENLDPGEFELVAVSRPLDEDPVQRRFRSICSEWHVIGDDPAAQIRGLDLDIALDLGGYGDLGLMQHCAERLAPVQVKWVGMQNHSSGLAEMDWFITDRWETPPEQEHLYSERLLFMPDGYACYMPPPNAPDVAPLPALRRGHVTFGCFNNYAKITPGVVATWCAILEAAPETRLLLKSVQLNGASTVAAAAARFAAHGIDPARVEVRGGSPHRALLEQYADVDLVLDPFPYSGGLTSCEALWMGVPVITMPGTTFASRHSTSHLCNIGLDDWVAHDLDAYRAQAVRRAADLPALAELRATLRPRMKASPLCDGPRFGRNLGAALRRVWVDWCARATAGEAPRAAA
jgi:predicted O-linked N-acetylglucosamine transferase (SPINDLY family)